VRVPTAALIIESYWTEHQHQVRFVDWCKFESPAAWRLKASQIYAIPNGGHRKPAVAAKLKAEGVVAGVPDLHLPIAAGREHGLYIEMKRPGERPTAAQLVRMTQLRKNGYRTVVAEGWRAAVEILTDYLEQA